MVRSAVLDHRAQQRRHQLAAAEAEQVRKARLARSAVIKVDDFSKEEMTPAKPRRTKAKAKADDA